MANYLVNKSSIHQKTLEENESLKNQNDEQSNQIALLNMALNEKEYKISLLNSSLETGKQEKLELEQQLDLSLKKQQSLQEEILLKEQKISELSTLNEVLESQLKSKQETNDNLSNEIEKLSSQISMLKNEKESLQSQLDTAHLTIANLNEELSIKNQAISNYLQQIEILQEEKEALNQRISELESTSSSNAGTISLGSLEYNVIGKIVNSNINIKKDYLINQSLLNQLSGEITTIYLQRQVEFTYIGGDGCSHAVDVYCEFLEGNNFYYNNEDSGFAVTSTITLVNQNGDLVDLSQYNESNRFRVISVNVNNLTCYDDQTGMNYNGHRLKNADVIVTLEYFD